MSKKLLLLCLVMIFLLFALLFNYNYHKKYPSLSLSEINRLEIASVWFNGDISSQSDADKIVKFFNELQLYSMGNYKFPHESADAYIKLYNASDKLVFEFWCYGGNGLMDVIADKRYYIKDSAMENLYDILRELG